MWTDHVEMLKKNKCHCKLKDGQQRQCGWYNVEIDKPHKNCKFQEAKALFPPNASDEAISVNATIMLDELSYQNGLTSFYKWGASIEDVFSQLGPETLLFGVMMRENPVDMRICAVNDCFKKGRAVGTPVFYNKTANSWDKSNGCFSRRFDTHDKQAKKVYFYEDKFDEMIHTLEEFEIEKQRHDIITMYEDLTAFEYTNNEEVFKSSMNAWHLLANRFVADSDVDYDIIEEELGQMRNTRVISYHKDIVANYEPFFHAIQNAGFGKYIRTRSQL